MSRFASLFDSLVLIGLMGPEAAGREDTDAPDEGYSRHCSDRDPEAR